MIVEGGVDIADLYGVWGKIKGGAKAVGKGAKAAVKAPVKAVTALPSVATKAGAFVGRTAAGAAALPVTTAISLTKAAGETLATKVAAPLIKAPFQITAAALKPIVKPLFKGGGGGPAPGSAQEAAVEMVQSAPPIAPPPAQVSPEVQAAAQQAAAAVGLTPPAQAPLIPPPGVESSSAPLTVDPTTGAPMPPQGFWARLPTAAKIGIPLAGAAGLYFFFKRRGGRRSKS